MQRTDNDANTNGNFGRWKSLEDTLPPKERAVLFFARTRYPSSFQNQDVRGALGLGNDNREVCEVSEIFRSLKSKDLIRQEGNVRGPGTRGKYWTATCGNSPQDEKPANPWQRKAAMKLPLKDDVNLGKKPKVQQPQPAEDAQVEELAAVAPAAPAPEADSSTTVVNFPPKTRKQHAVDALLLEDPTLSNAEIARKCNCSDTYVNKRRVVHGLPARMPWAHMQEKRAKVMALLQAQPDLADREIAAQAGVSHTMVWSYRHKFEGSHDNLSSTSKKCKVAVVKNFLTTNPEKSDKWIADRVGCSPGLVYERRRTLGLPPVTELLDKALQEHPERTDESLAEEFGMSTLYVHQRRGYKRLSSPQPQQPPLPSTVVVVDTTTNASVQVNLEPEVPHASSDLLLKLQALSHKLRGVSQQLQEQVEEQQQFRAGIVKHINQCAQYLGVPVDAACDPITQLQLLEEQLRLLNDSLINCEHQLNGILR